MEGTEWQRAAADLEPLPPCRAIYKDPFRPHSENILVMCDAYEPPRVGEDGKDDVPLKAIPTNSRAGCAEVST